MINKIKQVQMSMLRNGWRLDML